MATASDIITRAARRLQIIAGEEAMTAAEQVDALQLFNDMLHGFGPRGIYYTHTTLAASDTVNMPDELLRALTLVFAQELALDFGRPIGAALAMEIAEARNALQAAYWVQPPADTDPLLRPRLRYLDLNRVD